ncbi:MAG: DNA repair protein RadA [Chloroflexi bacterium]|nr:DNA repair protein RadA [Chloroflexota bacterium]
MTRSPRQRVIYVCQQCGYQSPRWEGRCADCGAWNSLVETVEAPEPAPGRSVAMSAGMVRPVPLAQLQSSRFERVPVPIGEFSRVLGGGIVPGSVVLVGGDPGIGKSTLLLQLAGSLADQVGPVLYVSGEESAEQVKLRADRLSVGGERLFVLAETALDQVLVQIEEVRPRLVVVDSIQTMYLPAVPSAAGSVTQVRESAMALLRVAKATHIPIFIVGHVTKEGAIAGPRVLEHIVDTVLYLEGERFHSYRLLRGVKNRFGSTNEVGVFEMQGDGLAEVSNPSAVFLGERTGPTFGSAVAVTLEGTRPLLVEIQALTTTTTFGLPRRTANGIDLGRLLVLTAVLTKRVGLGLSNQDIYVNVVGGLKVSEPAADLAVAVAVASSFREVSIATDLAVIGEVGLSGELRRVGQLERRLAEAANLGFRRCLIPQSAASPRLAQQLGLTTIGAASVAEAIEIAWEP